MNGTNGLLYALNELRQKAGIYYRYIISNIKLKLTHTFSDILDQYV